MCKNTFFPFDALSFVSFFVRVSPPIIVVWINGISNFGHENIQTVLDVRIASRERSRVGAKNANCCLCVSSLGWLVRDRADNRQTLGEFVKRGIFSFEGRFSRGPALHHE